MKATGLADSPFFAAVAPPPTTARPETPQAPPAHPVYERGNPPSHKGTDAQPHARTSAQMHVRAPVQPHKRTSSRSGRALTRESYDVYRDQAEALEELRLRWRRERGRHITKGEVMRVLLDEILAMKR